MTPMPNSSKGQAGASVSLQRLRHGVAKLPEQGDEVFPLVDLGRVVGGPVLAVGDPHGLGFDRGAVRLFLSLDRELHGVDVLAPLLALLKVQAGAERIVAGVHHIGAVAGRRGDFVSQAVLLNAGDGGYRQAALLAARVSIVGAVGAESGDGVEVEAEDGRQGDVDKTS